VALVLGGNEQRDYDMLFGGQQQER